MRRCGCMKLLWQRHWWGEHECSGPIIWANTSYETGRFQPNGAERARTKISRQLIEDSGNYLKAFGGAGENRTHE